MKNLSSITNFRFFSFFIFFYSLAHAEIYLNSKVYCEPNEDQTEVPIGCVHPNWIRQGPSDQGSSHTCGFHASIDMVSALYRSQQPEDQIEQRGNTFSVLDSLTKSSRKPLDCRLEQVSTNIVPQLLRLQRDPKLSVGPIAQWTVKRTFDINSLLTNQANSCSLGCCQNGTTCPTGCHLECLYSLCTQSRPFFGLIHSIEDLSDFTSKITTDLKDPVLTFTEERREDRRSIPPFQIQTWDTFSSSQEITHQVVEYFKGGESILPLGISFCQQDQNPKACSSNHVVAAKALRLISCKNRSTGTVRTFHAISLMGSIPSADQGVFVLEDLAKGMFNHRFGLVSISPCDPKAHCSDSPILNTPASHAFFHYADAGDVENMLKTGGADEKFKEIFEKHRGYYGMTALHESAMNHDLNVATALINKGVPVDTTNQLGETALYTASSTGAKDIVRLLLAAGAQPNLPRTLDLQTPIFIAAIHGHTEIVQALIKSGAHVNDGIPSDQATPLLMAAQEGHTAVAEILLQNGANARTRLKGGQSALEAAVYDGHTEVIKLLLQHGAGEELKEDEQNPAWMYAMNRRNSNPNDKKWDKIIELLKPFRRSH